MNKSIDLNIECAGCNHIFELVIEYDYTPPEPAETGPEAQYPGCEEVIEIAEICLRVCGLRELWCYGDRTEAGDRITDIVLPCPCGEIIKRTLAGLEREILKKLHEEAADVY